MSIKELKRAIRDFRIEAEEEHDGSKCDLANILLRVIHNYEHKGREYIVRRYWKGAVNFLEEYNGCYH